MVMGTEELLRLTVAALMARTGERQNVVADALGLSQAQVSRKQAGRQHWSLEDVDGLAAHYGLHVLDLLAGPTHAVGVLHGSIPPLRPLDVPTPAVQSPRVNVQRLPVQRPAEPTVLPLPCVLCGQPCGDDVDGFPQHLSAEECAAAVAAAPPAPAPAAPAPAPVPQLPAEPSAPEPAAGATAEPAAPEPAPE
ncbi:helix-turn-helix transcriptional regulator, partial [Streptomyces sp. NPDC006459]|uniref:helix-turn-helix domain-containing protein n=1 Tax=Streptomyces sp. NPDC006459 TaxID=3154303 RepID=UPI0033B90F1F